MKQQVSKKIIFFTTISLFFVVFNLVAVNGTNPTNLPPPPSSGTNGNSKSSIQPSNGMVKYGAVYVPQLFIDLYSENGNWKYRVNYNPQTKIWTTPEDINYVFNSDGKYYYTFNGKIEVGSCYKCDGEEQFEMSLELFNKIGGFDRIKSFDDNKITLTTGKTLSYDSQTKTYTLLNSEGKRDTAYNLQEGILFEIKYDKDDSTKIDTYRINGKKVNKDTYDKIEEQLVLLTTTELDSNQQQILSVLISNENLKDIKSITTNGDGTLSVTYNGDNQNKDKKTYFMDGTEVYSKDENNVVYDKNGKVVGAYDSNGADSKIVTFQDINQISDCSKYSGDKKSQCENYYYARQGAFGSLGVYKIYDWVKNKLNLAVDVADSIYQGAAVGNSIWKMLTGDTNFDWGDWADNVFPNYDAIFIGGDYHANRECLKGDDSAVNNGFSANYFSEGASAGAFIVAYKSLPINNGTNTFILYKIEYVVNAPKERAVFNVNLYYNGGIKNPYTSNIVVEKGNSTSKLGYQALVKYSGYDYSKACLKFAEGINNYYVQGLPFYENNEICTPIKSYSELEEENLLQENSDVANGESSTGGTTTTSTGTDW